MADLGGENDAHNGLFEGMRIYVSKTIPELQTRQLTKILTREQAQLVEFDDPALTHFVTESVPTPDSLEYAAPRTGLYYATPLWIERTVILGTNQEPDFYSPHPAMLFSGVVATATDLSKSDNEVMAAGISSLGGQWRYALTRDVTHLFALGTGSLKYRTAMHFKDPTQNEIPLPIKILVPHWFDDVVRLGVRNLPTEPYEWPEPRVFSGHAAGVLKATGAKSIATGDEERDSRHGRPLSSQKNALYDTIFQTTIDLPKHRPASSETWNGLKVMFGSNLGFTARQREAHVADVIRGGGEAVEFESPEEELEKLEAADVYIAQYRSGPAFVKAYKLKKTIGNLHWFWYVRCTGTLSRPTDQLLHYPIPKTPIAGFSRHLITITNFTGKDREYIKKLLLVLGAPFTPTMSGKNTAVIASFLEGDKTSRASVWGIPVVNHMWLEDCFAQWRDISPAQEKYTSFPPGVNFGDLLADDGGRAGLGLAGGTSATGRVGYDQAELDRMEHEIEAEEEAEVLASIERREEKENRPVPGPEITETPKRGILKKSAGATEDAAATSRRLAAKRSARREGEDVDMDDVVEASSNVFQDMTVALDDDGRLSELGIEPDQQDEDEDEDEDELHISPKRRGKQTRSDNGHPSTPMRGGPRGSFSPDKMVGTPHTQGKHLAQTRSIAKQKNRSVPPPSPSDNDDEAGSPSPVKPKRALATPKPITKIFEDESEEEQSIEEAPRPEQPASRRAAMKGKAPAKSTTDGKRDSAFVQGSSARKGTVIKTYRSMSRSRSRSRARSPRRDDVEDVLPSTSKPTTAFKRRARPSADEDANTEVRGRSSSKRNPVTPTTTRRQADIPTDGESEVGHSGKPKTRRAQTVELDEDGNPLTASPPQARTPRRRASVLLPTLAQVRSTSSQRPDTPSNSQAARPVSTERKITAEKSIVMQAKDAAQESPKRGRPSSKRSSKPKPETPESSLSRSSSPPSPSVLLTQAKRRPPVPAPAPAAAPVPAPEAGPSRVVEVSMTHRRRSAATKAAQKLHDEIMPDVARFQKELKSGHVKSAHEEGQIPKKEKGKEKESAPKGRKRVSLEGARDDESDVEPDRKKRKIEVQPPVTVSKKRKSDPPAPEVVVEEPKKRGRPRKSTTATQAAETQSSDRNIVIMTTQVNLSDDQTKALTKMGVKFTTKPLECTHLVARGIVRTEKFLVAMAAAPHIVTDKWVEMSISKKKFLPEKDYMLKDPDNEKRYGYKLSDAVARARENGRHLFDGMTFYVTSKVPVDSKLLKAVITAGGGQFSTQNPTVRILKGQDNRFVISSPADVSIWRPLSESGFPIYTHELILTSVLQQKVNWDNKGYLVAGSF